MNYGWIGRCWRRKTSPQRLLRSHLTLVLALIPIVLSAMRFSAVANGDRATLVRQLSALDVKSTLLGPVTRRQNTSQLRQGFAQPDVGR